MSKENKDVCLGKADIEGILGELTVIRANIVSELAMSQKRLDEVHANNRESARNLLHYMVLRRYDLRCLQLRLAKLGLSSLGRAESHVLATVDSVLGVLHCMGQRNWHHVSDEVPVMDFLHGERLLAEHTDALFGSSTLAGKVRIMVTMPSEAADDYFIVHNLLQQGMDCMRINCAHDNAASWLRMIEHLKRAESSLGRSCRVVMDLAGPKLRTGPLEPGPMVVRIFPTRDVYGHVTAPARIWLTAEHFPQQPSSPASACLPVPSTWLDNLCIGDRVTFTDARDEKRVLKVVEIKESGCWAEATKTAYIIPGIVLTNERLETVDERDARVGALPPGDNFISLKQGDLLVLTRDLKPGCPATYDHNGQLLTPAVIGCTIPEIFDDVRVGESLWFDDGKIRGVVEKVENTHVLVRITQDHMKVLKLRADKGINFPESNLHLSAMTAKDIEDLSFIVQHADIVALSFVNSAQDVALLQQCMENLGRRQLAIVLKIETRRGFENLPDILLTAMRAPSFGVMIARGDLAVECGFERMAEVQEEILWFCEAAHVPVIWATQVLETLAQKGLPSRAEITDAAMGRRAECVMLNKGPYVLNALQVLDNILRRMQSHYAKKSSMLRELHLAHLFPYGFDCGEEVLKPVIENLEKTSN